MLRDSAYIWIGPLVAMVVAQLLKPLVIMIQERSFDIARMRQSGGMPSSHTALVVALVTELWLREGGRNPVLALAIFIAFIVMYDAAGVRWQTGRQAAVLNRLLHDLQRAKLTEAQLQQSSSVQGIRPLQVAKAPWWLVDWPVLNEHVGHKKIEVLGGGIVGIIVALYLH
ncbi:divergent PAP2 family protein [Alicyclobacillus tolerans]|uniref:divergent PAP2 family protein n=1 Tax=Alicyclobacillus tolerans TaxID=90970 RepID=UPI001F3C6938|nr:divergent PAP2 family protein [Alicyclobacillus tolerans]MCF8567285.1 divergent PAP2 family protein [Alicyclobacillus tolerans]